MIGNLVSTQNGVVVVHCHDGHILSLPPLDAIALARELVDHAAQAHGEQLVQADMDHREEERKKKNENH